VQQAVQEFNSDSESGQPKWLREPDRTAKADPRSQQRGDESGTARRRRRSSATRSKAQQSATDEALMLEGERAAPSRRPAPRSRAEPRFDSSADNSRDHSPVVPSRLRETHSPQPAFMRQQQPPKPLRKLICPVRGQRSVDRQMKSKRTAYVSSARRRRPPAQPPVTASETRSA